jgi:O-acetyl-ADP-ribose deacetylase
LSEIGGCEISWRDSNKALIFFAFILTILLSLRFINQFVIRIFTCNTMIELIQGDITKVKVDAIVNAANDTLLGGGGVDGAIHRAGGKSILEECQKIRNIQGGCKVGEAVITTAGNLPSKFVIHAVGPFWNHDNERVNQLLHLAYLNSLKLAVKNKIQTVAFPNISTGIYHFPKMKAAEIAIDTVKNFLENNDSLQKVIFVCYDSENYSIYCKLLNFATNS